MSRISLSIAVWIGIIYLILILVFILLTFFEKDFLFFKFEFIKNHGILFFFISYSIQSSVYPFLYILISISFTECVLKHENWQEKLLTNPNVYRFFLICFFIMIIGQSASFMFRKFFQDRKILKWLIIIVWIIVNLTFLIISSIAWCILYLDNLNWTDIMVCILFPIEIVLELSFQFCFKTCSCCYKPLATSIAVLNNKYTLLCYVEYRGLSL